MSREVLKMALEVLENPCRWDLDSHKTIAEIKKALAQPEQEPVAWAYVNSDDECEQIEYCTESPMPEFVPLYASPPQRQLLTEEQLDALALDDDGLPNSHFEFARAIEKAHGIGNKT